MDLIKCPHCGRATPLTYERCTFCGEKIKESSEGNEHRDDVNTLQPDKEAIQLNEERIRKALSKGSKSKRSKAVKAMLITAAAITALYMYYLYEQLKPSSDQTDVASFAGWMVGFSILVSHLACVMTGAALALFAEEKYNRKLALGAFIANAVGIILFPMYALFVVVQTALCLAAFLMMEEPQDN